MEYNSIRLTVYEPNRASGPYQLPLYNLRFPQTWREKLLEFYRLDKRRPDTIRQVPIRRLNEVIQVAAPDLVSVARGATVNDDAPWLYSRSPFPLAVLHRMVLAWIRDLHPEPKYTEATTNLLKELDLDELQWSDAPEPVDLLGTRLSEGGWVEPNPAVFQLLPDELAQRILTLPPYRLDDVELSFRIAPRFRGAELVSWPPRPHDDEDGTWYFSFVIALTVQTVPFANDFRVHIRTGVRRWCTQGTVHVPYRRTVSTYLLTDKSWLQDGPPTDRLALSRLARGAEPDTYAWTRGGPEGMLARLRFAKDLPDPEQLQTAPAAWLDGVNGVKAAVTYSTMMGQHGVGAGLMPADRAPLADWAAQALGPELRRLPDHVRSRCSGVPRNLPKSPTGKTEAEKEASKAAIKRETQLTRRRAIARVLGGPPLRVDVFWQDPRTRDGLIDQLCDALGLDGDGGTGEERTWSTPELEVRLQVRDAGKIAAPLEFPTPKPKASDLPAALRARRQFVAEQFDAMDGAPSDLSIVEIGRPEGFRLDDPKFAIRLGAADAGRLTQFITVPSKRHKTHTRASIKHRAEWSWLDGFRQLGVRVLPELDLPDAPTDLSVVALWMVKRRADGPTRQRRLTPVAVRTDPDDTISGWDADSGEWIPYRRLLLTLTKQADIPGGDSPAEDGQARPTRKGLDREDQQAVAQQFIKAVLYSLRDTPTLLLTHAQNTRSLWPWLGNGKLKPEMLQFGDSPAQRTSLYGKWLYHVHIRDNSQDETGQWYAVDADKKKSGLAKGLWHPKNADGDCRTFVSTAEKPDTAKNAAVAASKLTTRTNRKGETVIDTGENAWNPGLVDNTVVSNGNDRRLDPELLAAIAHQYRHAPDYRGALAMPLQMHLAKRASQYVLPHDNDDEASLPEAADDMVGDLGKS